MTLPNHIGIIPDGNRRWAQQNGLPKKQGYQHGLQPGLELFRLCRQLGIKELTYYGFTMDNTKRPSEQTAAFRQACVQAVEMLAREDASLLVVGKQDSPLFPPKLLTYTQRTNFGSGNIKVNFLVNYGWQWDIKNILSNKKENKKKKSQKISRKLQKNSHVTTKTITKNKIQNKTNNPNNKKITEYLHSSDISRIDLIIRWGNHRRLSGFLPLQSVYADIFVVSELWPNFKEKHLQKALKWYDKQDPTYGG